MKAKAILFLKIVVAFVLLGPPIGSLFVSGLLLLTSGEGGSPGSSAMVVFMGLFVSYLFGGIQALLTGIYLAFISCTHRCLNRLIYYGISSIPVVILILYSAGISKILEYFNSPEETPSMLILAPAGVFSAYVMLRLTKSALAGTPHALIPSKQLKCSEQL